MQAETDKIKDVILELIKTYELEGLEITTDPTAPDDDDLTHTSSDECEWVEEQNPSGGTSWKCQQTSGETCKTGSCKTLTIRVTVNGVTTTESYCNCM